MTVRKAFEKAPDRRASERSVTEVIEEAKAKKKAELEFVESDEATIARRDEMSNALGDLNATVGNLIEVLALMKHPNQRPALRAIAREVPNHPVSDAVRVATLANQIQRALDEFKKGGA